MKCDINKIMPLISSSNNPKMSGLRCLFIFAVTSVATVHSSPSCEDCNNFEVFFKNLRDPSPTRGLLYPTESESREVRSLDGIWRFKKSNTSDPMQGIREKWFADDLDKVGDTIPMPVPSSYNDITVDAALRDHVGIVWYERKFYVPPSWAMDQRIWLRFGSVNYAAIVWLNGEQITEHTIGHLPFGAEITHNVLYGDTNRLTVLCDNSLLNTTIPQGKIVEEPSDNGKTLVQTYTFDFFNYAGIHRTVHLYTTPTVYIEDVQIWTDIVKNSTGLVHYKITTDGLVDKTAKGISKNIIYEPSIEPLMLHVQLRDKSGYVVAHDAAKSKLEGTVEVDSVNAWWPYLMNSDYGYLYTIEFYLHAADFALLDVYRLKVGVRKLSWDNTTILLNGKPIYMRGFGRHEDADIRGRGLDLATLSRDFNLLKWVGANAYRTSHYPYSEESMQFADEHGIMIIDECPSVNTDIFETELLLNHKSALEQLIHRDRNHASVIMWSLANEPRSGHEKAGAYFGTLANYTKTLDAFRPLTAAINVEIQKDKLAPHLDIISFNRYNGWYQNAGHLDMITDRVVNEAIAWHKMYNKPIVMTEYGADTLEGMHFLPTYIWSEDYQKDLLSKHFKAFDILREKKWFIGEFCWNFADFKTEQTYTRVGGNKKGLFTRNRQPKTAAHLLRQRYYALGFKLDKCEVPKDAFQYIIDRVHTEL